VVEAFAGSCHDGRRGASERLPSASMSDELTFLPLLGSLRRGSYNRMALAAARERLPDGVTMLPEPDLRPVPPYDDDVRVDEGFPPVVAALRESIRAADAVLFVTPEYNFSIPGVLKNAIDWASRAPDQPFRDKPVGMMGAAGGPVGTERMQLHLRHVLAFLDARPINKPEVLIGRAAERFDEDGRLADEATATLIADHLQALADWTRRLRGTRETA
jgi:chromate reductase, NAD(P)H dehydrogenase (quinone)